MVGRSDGQTVGCTEAVLSDARDVEWLSFIGGEDRFAGHSVRGARGGAMVYQRGRRERGRRENAPVEGEPARRGRIGCRARVSGDDAEPSSAGGAER